MANPFGLFLVYQKLTEPEAFDAVMVGKKAGLYPPMSKVSVVTLTVLSALMVVCEIVTPKPVGSLDVMLAWKPLALIVKFL